jgi:ElaB/YqjD/DUF883 family membrane-anchored ribosome-binding protein
MEPKTANRTRVEGSPTNASGGGHEAAGSVARGPAALGTVAAESANSAAADLQSLRNDLNRLTETMTKLISHAGDEAARSARDVASSLVTQVGDVATDLASRGADAASATGMQAKSLLTEFENMTRRNPLGAIAGAMAIGLLVGMLGRRS